MHEYIEWVVRWLFSSLVSVLYIFAFPETLKFKTISRVCRTLFKIYVSLTHSVNVPLFALGYAVDFPANHCIDSACNLSIRSGCRDSIYVRIRATEQCTHEFNNLIIVCLALQLCSRFKKHCKRRTMQALLHR